MSIELAEESQRQAPLERPTVGRRLYYWSHLHNGVLDPAQAFDAGVLFVHEDTGTTRRFPHFELVTAEGARATWVPSITDLLAEDWEVL